MDNPETRGTMGTQNTGRRLWKNHTYVAQYRKLKKLETRTHLKKNGG